MKAILFVVISFFTTLVQIQGCDVPENDRISCNIEDETECTDAGCTWCGTSEPNCFVPADNILTGTGAAQFGAFRCPSDTASCTVNINCHPDNRAFTPSENACIARGCLWKSSSSSNPRCVYSSSVAPTDETDTEYFPYDTVACRTGECSSGTCPNPVNCLGFEPSWIQTENRCEREGCAWCAGSDPSCRVGGEDTGLTQLTAECNSCEDCPNNAYLKATSRSDCVARGGTWCRNRPKVRRCITRNRLDTRNEDTKKINTLKNMGREWCPTCADCELVIDCNSAELTTQEMCEGAGCLWCPDEPGMCDDRPNCRHGGPRIQCTSCDNCDMQVPRFQKANFTRQASRPLETFLLKEVLCLSQRGLWCEDTPDNCLSYSGTYPN